VRALGLQESELCMACLNGEYPTHIPGEHMRFQKRLDVE
jgi:amidophosphoribosyltransferase